MYHSQTKLNERMPCNANSKIPSCIDKSSKLHKTRIDGQKFHCSFRVVSRFSVNLLSSFEIHYQPSPITQQIFYYPLLLIYVTEYFVLAHQLVHKLPAVILFCCLPSTAFPRFFRKKTEYFCICGFFLYRLCRAGKWIASSVQGELLSVACTSPDQKAIPNGQFMCVLPLLYANSFSFCKFLIYGLILCSIMKFINFLRIILPSTATDKCSSSVFYCEGRVCLANSFPSEFPRPDATNADQRTFNYCRVMCTQPHSIGSTSNNNQSLFQLIS